MHIGPWLTQQLATSSGVCITILGQHYLIETVHLAHNDQMIKECIQRKARFRLPHWDKECWVQRIRFNIYTDNKGRKGTLNKLIGEK